MPYHVRELLGWAARPGKFFEYGFDVIEEKGKRYAFYCSNQESGRIRDHIYVRQALQSEYEQWVWGEPILVLSHGDAANDWYTGSARIACMRRLFDEHFPGDPHPLAPQNGNDRVQGEVLGIPTKGAADHRVKHFMRHEHGGYDCIWDLQHACDPAVVAATGYTEDNEDGNGFWLRGEKYQYAMFYLGIHRDHYVGVSKEINNQERMRYAEANHIGMAVANSLVGPWHKRADPLVEGVKWWGVGQASATATANPSEVLLMFTRGDNGGAGYGQNRIIVNLRDVDNPVIVCEETSITTSGLMDKVGYDWVAASKDFTNAAFAYDPHGKKFWVVREGRPRPAGFGISSHVQVAWIDEAAVWNPKGEHSWTLVEPEIRAAGLGTLTHNPGFVKDVWGNIFPERNVEIMVTVADPALNPHDLPEWTYQPREICIFPVS